MCYNDQIAADVIRVLEELGKKVPEDISVTGYDEFHYGGNLSLTTIAHHGEAGQS